MKMTKIPFTQILWDKIQPQTIPGATGNSIMRCYEQAGIRMRMIEYSAGYCADHFCNKGHVVHVLKGSFTITLDDGRLIRFSSGSSFIVGDDIDAHRAESSDGATVFIVD